MAMTVQAALGRGSGLLVPVCANLLFGLSFEVTNVIRLMTCTATVSGFFVSPFS